MLPPQLGPVLAWRNSSHKHTTTYLEKAGRGKKSVPMIQGFFFLGGGSFFFFEVVRSFSNVTVSFLSTLALRINPQRRKLEHDPQPQGTYF